MQLTCRLKIAEVERDSRVIEQVFPKIRRARFQAEEGQFGIGKDFIGGEEGTIFL